MEKTSWRLRLKLKSTKKDKENFTNMTKGEQKKMLYMMRLYLLQNQWKRSEEALSNHVDRHLMDRSITSTLMKAME